DAEAATAGLLQLRSLVRRPGPRGDDRGFSPRRHIADGGGDRDDRVEIRRLGSTGATTGLAGVRFMTEKEWLACTDPNPMLAFLRLKTSERKLRLFVCACTRRVWLYPAPKTVPPEVRVGLSGFTLSVNPTVPDEDIRRAVEIAEQMANRQPGESGWVS